MINKYNKIIEKIVDKFAKRYFKEIFNENEADYRLMDYHWIPNMLELNDMYLDINDILIAELYQIPCKIYRDYYYLCLDTEWKPWINLYNFFRKTCYKENEVEEKESLKKSEENVKEAKEELEKIIKGSK